MDSIFENIIYKHESFGKEAFIDNNEGKLHIAFCVNENYVCYMGITITSIILNNENDYFVFHIFAENINRNDLAKLKKLCQIYQNIKIHIYYVDVKKFKILPMNSVGSYAVYYRFIVPEVLDQSIERILYLDADVLCLGSLEEIQEIDMQNNIVMAIEDSQLKDRLFDINRKLGIKSGKYFNAGVLYVDIKKWKKEQVSKKAINLLVNSMDRYEFWDQDILNILLEQKVKFIENKWNYMCGLYYRQNKISIALDVQLVHYVTGDKPWKSWTLHHPMAKVYQEYKKKSLWADLCLTEPKTYKEKHRMAISCMKRNLYMQSAKWYLLYFLGKIKYLLKIKK